MHFSHFQFRPFTRADLSMASRWLHTPEVVRWWGDPAEQLAHLAADLDDPKMRQWIVKDESRAFAYVQAYPARAWPQSPFMHMPDGTEAIDVCIGEPDMLGRGHGSALLRQFAERLVAEGAPAVLIDPHMDNHRTHRACARAGFVRDKVVETNDGPAVLFIFRKDRNNAEAHVQQIERLAQLGVPERLGLSPDAFRQALRPLQESLVAAAEDADLDGGKVAAVLVVNSPLVPARDMLALLQRAGKPAVERLHPKQLEDFAPTADIELPAGEAYLLLGVDRGNSTLNVLPSDALKLLSAERRSPLTIEEGIAVLLQWPLFLQPNRCFMMLGSRCGDRRVPALWLSGKHPKLGWCWEGNPHTWLGFASCLRRSVGVRLGGVNASQVPSRPRHRHE